MTTLIVKLFVIFYHWMDVFFFLIYNLKKYSPKKEPLVFKKYNSISECKIETIVEEWYHNQIKEGYFELKTLIINCKAEISDSWTDYESIIEKKSAGIILSILLN